MEKTAEQLEQERLEQERLKKEKKEYTQEELTSLIQQESDKRVTEAIKTREEKLRKEMDDKIQKAREEAERVAKLSAEEKEKELRGKALKELEERELNLTRKELLSETKDELTKNGLPVTFAPWVVGNDLETTVENIKKLKESWDKDLEKAINDRLKGAPQEQGGSRGPIKQEDFNKMSYEDRLKLKKDKPELYKELSNKN